MVSSGMLRRVALVRTDVSKEASASFIRVTASVVPSSPILVTHEAGARFLRNVGSYKTNTA
jgi:hypothetical protein